MVCVLTYGMVHRTVCNGKVKGHPLRDGPLFLKRLT